MSKVFVVNSKSEKEPFSPQKVYRSTRRAGASPVLAQKITKEITKFVYPGIRTSEIYQRIRTILQKEEPKTAIRYRIKEAIRKLGPTGFPFEKFIGGIYKQWGYQVRFNQEIKGRCVRYEIDFLAESDKEILIGECKFHHSSGERVDLRIALANHAKFLDLLKSSYLLGKKKKISFILVTNTKFTGQAIEYSRCVELSLLGWSYPPGQGLEKIITENKFYPVTILPSFKGFLKEIFSSQKIMLVEEILKIDYKRFARENNIPEPLIRKIVSEAKILLD